MGYGAVAAGKLKKILPSMGGSSSNEGSSVDQRPSDDTFVHIERITDKERKVYQLAIHLENPANNLISLLDQNNRYSFTCTQKRQVNEGTFQKRNSLVIS